MLKKNKIGVNSLLLGLFFLVWATNAFVLFGNTGKYASLFLGIYFLTKAILVNKISQSSFFLLFKSAIVYGIFVLIAIILQQETTTPLMLVFGLICLWLFFLGGVFRTTILIEEKNNPKLIIGITFLMVLSSVKLYFMQSLFSNNISSREIANGDLNAVGVAYAQGQLLLLFLWLFAREKLAFMKYILIVALVSILVIMILTGSRGALLYVVVTLVFFYRHLILYLFNFKTFLISLIIGVSLMYTIKENEFLNFKITALADRFTSALYYLEGTKEDGSLRARKEIQTVFYDNYDEMLLGYEGYRPYPHNQFIEIYMRWGLIGLPLLIISLFSFLSAIKLIKKKNRVTSSIDYLVISLFFFCFLQSMSSLTLEMNRLMFFGLGYFVIDFRSRKSIS